MKQMRIISILLAFAMMLCSFSTVSFSDDTDEGAITPGDKPIIRILGSTIEYNDEYFELTMQIAPPAGKTFSTAGIVLKYDKSLITPVAWDEPGTEVPLSGCTDWQHVVAIPTVVPEEISGGTALAYQTDNFGYIYMSSEASLPLTNLPNGGKLVSVRFRYAGATEAAMAATKASVISKFEAGGVVSLAEDAVAAASHAGQQALFFLGDDNLTEYYYSSEADTVGLKADNTMDAPVYKLLEDQKSVKSGDVDMAQFGALVFFDWDETTLLGSAVLNGAASKDVIMTEINRITEGFMPPGVNMSNWTAADNAHENYVAKAKALEDAIAAADDPATDVAVQAAQAAADAAKLAETEALNVIRNYDTYDTNYLLTKHNGYTFGKWIDFNSEEFTIYGQAVNATSATTMNNIEVPENPDYTNISQGLVLKAAYVANKKIDPDSILTTQVLRRYTISNSKDVNDGYFGRYNASNYAVRVKVSRVNASGNPVQRTRETALRVTYRVGSATIITLLKLENLDEQIAEVAVPSTATQVTFAVIDIGGVPNWATGSATRTANFNVTQADFTLYGMINYFNELPYDSTATTPTAAVFTSAGLNVSTVYGAASGSERSQAVINIKNGREQKAADLKKAGGDEKRNYLTLEEMQNAITYGNYKG